MRTDISAIADEYINKFIDSEHSIIKIDDEVYSRIELREALVSRVKERDLHTIIVYVFMNNLYMEKT